MPTGGFIVPVCGTAQSTGVGQPWHSHIPIPVSTGTLGKHCPKDQGQPLAMVESEQPSSDTERPHRQVLSPEVLEGSVWGEKCHQ